jgi:hypothetical protein
MSAANRSGATLRHIVTAGKDEDHDSNLVGVLLLGLTMRTQTPAAGGFTPLFDGKTLNNWVVDGSQYSKNFSVRDGLLRIEGEGGWLRSSRQYGDFTLRLGFRYLTDDPARGRVGVSGVFLRTPATSTYQSGWPDNSLEVQLANRQGGRPAMPGDARWGGAVLRHGNLGGPPPSIPARRCYPTARLATGRPGDSGDWRRHSRDFERQLPRTASAGSNARGFIGLQAETGGIEFRTVEINEGVKGSRLACRGLRSTLRRKNAHRLETGKAGSPGFDIVDGAWSCAAVRQCTEQAHLQWQHLDGEGVRRLHPALPGAVRDERLGRRPVFSDPFVGGTGCPKCDHHKAGWMEPD